MNVMPFSPDLPDSVDAAAVVSVGGLTSYLQDVLEEDPQLRQVWVTGEVSSANSHRLGLFFTLHDPDDRAAIGCVAWKRTLSNLCVWPEVGEQVVILGRVGIYPQRSAYQLVASQIIPAGEGLQALRLRQLQQRLEAEGLFDEARKRSLPLHPKTIAVVTSAQAAAWGDIQRSLHQRYPGMHVLLSSATVQGEQAPASIVRAIQRVVEDGRAEVLILSRGGGAREDLACFNDERVVRAVVECPIPVVTGIGHQRDESLTDLAADVCAHTPTAAVEWAVPALERLWAEHQERVIQVRTIMGDRLLQEQHCLERLRDRLHRVPLASRLQQQQESLTWMRQRLVSTVQHRLQAEQQRCHLLRQTLQTLDPAAVLQRGYALVRQENGAIARSAQTLTPGQTLHIQLAEGTVQVQVLPTSSNAAPPSSLSPD